MNHVRKSDVLVEKKGAHATTEIVYMGIYMHVFFSRDASEQASGAV